MTMFATTVYLDRLVTATQLADVFASATGVAVDHVRVIARNEFERDPQPWFLDSVAVGIQTSELRGDFPLEVDLVARADLDVRAVLRSVARGRDVAILTDEFGVNPLSDAEWMMFTPDGSSIRVLADPEEFGADDPAIILEPESRTIYDAKRALPIVATR